jgi:hypothetical protein
MLTTQQSKSFIEAYMKRYAKDGESSLECSERIIHKGILANEKSEYDFFIKTITDIVKKPKKRIDKIVK